MSGSSAGFDPSLPNPFPARGERLIAAARGSVGGIEQVPSPNPSQSSVCQDQRYGTVTAWCQIQRGQARDYRMVTNVGAGLPALKWGPRGYGAMTAR